MDTGFRWRPGFGLGLDLAASAIRTALASAASRICCAGARLIEERLTRTDELLRLLLVDRHSAEFGSLQHRLDLRRQCIALSGPRRNLAFQIVIDRIIVGVALDGEVRNDQRALRQGAKGGVDLFVGLAQAQKRIGVGVQGAGQSVLIDHFQNHAAVVLVVVLEP